MQALSVIIPCYNSKELMKKHLPSLIREIDTNKDEVILVDDHSEDGGVQFVENTYPFIKIIKLERNVGFAHACNTGILNSKHDLVCLLNTDVEVMEGSIGSLIRRFEDKDIFVVCSMELHPSNEKPPYFILPGAEFRFGIFRFRYKPVTPDPSGLVPVLFAHGACTVYDKRKFTALGGYDTIYTPLYWEDMDICWRAWRRGWKSMCDTQSRVRHECKGTVDKIYTLEHINSFHWKNRFLFTWKEILSGWLVAEHLLFTVPALFILPLIGRKEFTIGFFRALKQLPQLLKSKRRSRIKNPVLYNRDIFARFPYNCQKAVK